MKELDFDFSEIIKHLSELRNTKDSEILEYFINLLNSNLIQTVFNKYDTKFYEKIENLKLQASQINIILKAIQSKENFFLPDTWKKYNSNTNECQDITKVINRIRNNISAVNNKECTMEDQRIFNQITIVINLLKDTKLITFNDIPDGVELSLMHTSFETRKRFLQEIFGNIFFEKLKEIKNKKEEKDNYNQEKFNVLDILFFFMNKDISYDEYIEKCKDIDMFSNLCVFNSFRKHKTFKQIFKIINNLLFMSQGVLNEEIDPEYYFVIKKETFAILLVESIEQKNLDRQPNKVIANKETFLKDPKKIKTDGHHIIEWHYIFKNRDKSVSKDEINNAMKLLNISKEDKNKYLQEISTIRDLIDNKYNLIPIPKSIHDKINNKSGADPIRNIAGKELNLYMELDVVDNKLCLKHLFNPKDTIILENLSSKNCKLKKENIQDLLVYNKIIREILKVDEFKERYKYIYKDTCKNKTKKRNRLSVDY